MKLVADFNYRFSKPLFRSQALSSKLRQSFMSSTGVAECNLAKKAKLENKHSWNCFPVNLLLRSIIMEAYKKSTYPYVQARATNSNSFFVDSKKKHRAIAHHDAHITKKYPGLAPRAAAPYVLGGPQQIAGAAAAFHDSNQRVFRKRFSFFRF